MKKNLKLAIVVLILVVTAVVFVRYAATHPEIIRKIGDISPTTLVVLLAAYTLSFTALVLILSVSLRMYDKRLNRQENILLNAYSSLVNFFGPGQSGPAVRGVYLKKRHGFGLKRYMFITLLYYACYAVLSAFLLFVGSRPWWQTVLLMAAAGACSVGIIQWYARRSQLGSQAGVHPKSLFLLLGATAIQMLGQSIIYYVELHSVDSTISVAQSLTYTGAANFSLFAALTPGAIGIREAFLLFSQNLHHISSAVIITANIIDRAVYLVFLGLLFIAVITTHAKKRLRLTTLHSKASEQNTI